MSARFFIEEVCNTEAYLCIQFVDMLHGNAFLLSNQDFKLP